MLARNWRGRPGSNRRGVARALTGFGASILLAGRGALAPVEQALRANVLTVDGAPAMMANILRLNGLFPPIPAMRRRQRVWSHNRCLLLRGALPVSRHFQIIDRGLGDAAEHRGGFASYRCHGRGVGEAQAPYRA